MKMPRRTFFPLVNPPPDVFGLHTLTLVGMALETDAERAQRVATIEGGVARSLWRSGSAISARRRRGGSFVASCESGSEARTKRRLRIAINDCWRLMMSVRRVRASPLSRGGFTQSSAPNSAIRQRRSRRKFASSGMSETNVATRQQFKSGVGAWRCTTRPPTLVGRHRAEEIAGGACSSSVIAEGLPIRIG